MCSEQQGKSFPFHQENFSRQTAFSNKWVSRRSREWRILISSERFFLLQLLSTRLRPPMLPLVYSLDLNASNLDQLDAKTLILWLLLASNARVLNICQGTTTAKMQLANRLKALIAEDTRLKFVTQSIEEVHVFYMFDSLNYATKQHVCQMYSDIFRKPVIRRWLSYKISKNTSWTHSWLTYW